MYCEAHGIEQAAEVVADEAKPHEQIASRDASKRRASGTGGRPTTP